MFDPCPIAFVRTITGIKGSCQEFSLDKGMSRENSPGVYGGKVSDETDDFIPSAPGDSDDARVIKDADTLRALGHPVRLALLEALLSGPLTATEAGALIGESATTCSFHFRQLARYGFVEEAGGGKGRARPWRRVDTRLRIPPRPEDPEYTKASQLVHGVMLDRYLERVRNAILDAPNGPREWYEAIIGTEMMFFITAEELREINDAIDDLRRRFTDRWGNRLQRELRPEGARAVELLFFGIPVAPGEEDRSELS